MVDTALIPAITAAIKTNEIGNASPYALSYAELGASGASFGIFQGDTNVNHTARATLLQALQANNTGRRRDNPHHGRGQPALPERQSIVAGGHPGRQ